MSQINPTGQSQNNLDEYVDGRDSSMNDSELELQSLSGREMYTRSISGSVENEEFG